MYLIKINDSISITTSNEKNYKTYFELLNKNRNYLRKWLGWVDEINSEEKAKQQLKNFDIEFKYNLTIPFFIWSQNKLIGFINLWNINHMNKSLQIGYWICESFEGKGITTLVCKTIISFAFQGLKFHRVEIHCATENKKSQSIPLKLGFRLEGTTREAECLRGQFLDHHLYGLLDREWKYSTPYQLIQI